MVARTPRASVEQVLAGLIAITRCVTDQPLHAVGYRQVAQDRVSIALLPLVRPAPLRATTGSSRVALAVKYDHSIVRSSERQQGFEAVTAAYAYRILDHNGDEILAYHWHPTGASAVTRPHLHLSSRLPPIVAERGGDVALAEMHIPTGFVSLADVVRLLITEFSVEPRRQNWTDILEIAAPAQEGVRT